MHCVYTVDVSTQCVCCSSYLHQPPEVHSPGASAGEWLALFLHRKVLRRASLTGRVPPF